MVRLLTLALLLLPAVAQAGSAQGSLLVSVTVVATCAVDATAATSVNVQCPQQQPFHVSVSPVAAVKRGIVDTSAARMISGSGRVSLAAPAAAVQDAGRTVNVLTVSY